MTVAHDSPKYSRPGLPTLLAFVLLACCNLKCNSGADIIGLDQSDFDIQGSSKQTKGSSNEGERSAADRTPSSPEEEDEDESNGSSLIEYPQLGFNAGGFTTCDGETYNTTASIVTSMDAKKLDISMTAAKVFCGSRCQDKADEEVQNSIGVTRYERTPKDQKDALVKEGFTDGPFAIFANSVTKVRQNHTYTFDKPLPVFPWPAALARYEALDSGPMQWRANVSGTDSFTIVVKISKVSERGDSVVLKWESVIQQDVDHSLYENFPMPREAVYTVDTVKRDVQQIDSINLFNGEKCRNKPERVQMTYKICTKTKKGKTENFSCS